MTYFVLIPLRLPHQIPGKRVDWENIVHTLQRRVDISGIWMTGRGILNPSEMPKTIIIKKRKRPPPAVFCSSGAIIICQERLKSILDELDPGLHQFIPIRIEYPSGEGPEDQFFILNVHHMQDTIIDEKSKADIGPLMPNNSNRHYRLVFGFARKDGDITVDKSKLSSVNLWREPAYPGLYMMSDALKQKLKRENLDFFNPHKATEF